MWMPRWLERRRRLLHRILRWVCLWSFREPNINYLAPGEEESLSELVGSECSCINCWIECPCDQWAGEFHKRCIGCFGLTKWDCIKVIQTPQCPRATENVFPCWMGWWLLSHKVTWLSSFFGANKASCVEDSQAGTHECTNCNDEYYLSDVDSGFCYPCDENCATCAPQGPTNCLCCYDGFYCPLMQLQVLYLVSNSTHAVEPVTVQLATSVFPVTLVQRFLKALLKEMTDIVSVQLDRKISAHVRALIAVKTVFSRWTRTMSIQLIWPCYLFRFLIANRTSKYCIRQPQ